MSRIHSVSIGFIADCPSPLNFCRQRPFIGGLEPRVALDGSCRNHFPRQILSLTYFKTVRMICSWIVRQPCPLRLRFGTFDTSVFLATLVIWILHLEYKRWSVVIWYVPPGGPIVLQPHMVKSRINAVASQSHPAISPTRPDADPALLGGTAANLGRR